MRVLIVEDEDKMAEALRHGLEADHKNGASQAVRLPVEFRFEGDEVYVMRDDATGDVMLSHRPGAKTWGEFFELLHATKVPADFMAERPMNVLSTAQGLFDD